MKRVLIDGGVGLKICTLKVILALGFSKEAIDSKKKIIKSCDDEKCKLMSKGTVTLTITVGPMVKDVVCQVLDLDRAPIAYSWVILGSMSYVSNCFYVPSMYQIPEQ